MQLILPLLLLMTVYFVVLPQRRRTQAQRALSAALTPGDQVVTAGGVIGRLIAVDDDRATVEVAPGVEVEFLVQSIVRRVVPADPETDPETDPVDTPTVDAPAVDEAPGNEEI